MREGVIKKILIVDALPSSLARHKLQLAPNDVLVFGSTSAEEALKIHRAERVDVVVVDLDLPQGDAETLCRRLRSDPGLTRVSVIVLCRNSEDDLERASRCQANACLTRPVRSAQLRQALERLLEVPERRSYRVLVRAEADGRAPKGPFFCTSSNLSAAGMLIEADAALEKGAAVTCSFFLPDRARIVATGEVVRIARRPGGAFQYGLKFLRLGPGERAAINAFVSARPSRG